MANALITSEVIDALKEFDGEITAEYIKSILPEGKYQRSIITPDLLQFIKDAHLDPNFHANQYLANFVDYTDAIKQGSGCTVKQYAEAIKYCGFIHLGYTQRRAYEATFPQKCKIIKKQIEENYLKGKQEYAQDTDDDLELSLNDAYKRRITAKATGFAHNGTVKRILAQAKMSEELLFTSARMRAFNKLDQLTNKAKSEFVQMSSAKALIELTNPVKENQIQVNIQNNTNSIDVIAEYRQAALGLAKKQQLAIKQGISVKTIAESNIITPVE